MGGPSVNDPVDEPTVQNWHWGEKWGGATGSPGRDGEDFGQIAQARERQPRRRKK